MALQDLTPQLRTRLSRVERAVGLFVTIATLLMIGGFAFYIYHTAERRGWTKTKVKYSTGLNNAAGLKEGDPVTLMGFKVGEILKIEANDPGEYYGVTVYFQVMEPYYGYVWLDSKVRVAAADFLGKRSLEISKGRDMAPTVLSKAKQVTAILNSDIVDRKFKELTKKIQTENPGFTKHSAQYDATNELNALIAKMGPDFYSDPKEVKPYWIEPIESPALTETLETMVNDVKGGLPGIFAMTNQLNTMLASANKTTTNLNALLTPLLTNMLTISKILTNSQGGLGEWILTPELKAQIDAAVTGLTNTLTNADLLMASVDTTITNQNINLTETLSNLNLTLISVAGITSNLNNQVQANTNLVKGISDAIIHADEMVQGLKRHWLLRSAFKTNQTDKVEKEPRDKSTKPRLTTPRNTP